MYTSETLRHIGTQIEALMSRQCSLHLHKRAIERQLASIAAQIHEPDLLLTPGTVFLLLEMRGSGGVSSQLEQIARILHEEGYWTPHERVWNYQRQDVYHLGKSVQRLFDDSVVLDRCLERMQAGIEHLRQHHHLPPEAAPQQVLDSLATVADLAAVQGEVEAIVELLEPAHRRGWFRCWLFLHRSRHKLRNASHRWFF